MDIFTTQVPIPTESITDSSPTELVNNATTEIPVVPPTEPKIDIDEVTFASRMNMLTKKEKDLLQKQAEIKALEDTISKYKELTSKAKENPLAILEHFELDYDQLTDYVVNQTTPEEKRFKDLQNQIEQMRKERLEEVENSKKLKEEGEKAAQESRVAENVQAFKKTIQEVAQDPEFELLNTYKSFDLVFDVCKQYYEKNKKMIDVKTACNWVEKHLESQLDTALRIEKIRKKVSMQSNQDFSEVITPTKDSSTYRNFDTNASTVAPPSAASAEERFRRSIEIFTGKVQA